MRQGRRLITKLWNAARFAQEAGSRQDAGDAQPLGAALAQSDATHAVALPADRWLLSALQDLIAQATARWLEYDYAGALDLTERFFWGTLCDQYLELVKGRLYDGTEEERASARTSLALAFEAILKLLAPIMPHICEEIWQGLFPGRGSIHVAAWPEARPELRDEAADAAGAALIAVAGAVRRHKSARGLSLGAPLPGLSLACAEPGLRALLAASEQELRSVSRAARIDWAEEPGAGFEELAAGLWLRIED